MSHLKQKKLIIDFKKVNMRSSKIMFSDDMVAAIFPFPPAYDGGSAIATRRRRNINKQKVL